MVLLRNPYKAPFATTVDWRTLSLHIHQSTLTCFAKKNMNMDLCSTDDLL